jgi:hypothetical protein
MVESMWSKGTYLIVARKQREKRKGPGIRHALQRHIPSDLLLLPRLYLLMAHSYINPVD